MKTYTTTLIVTTAAALLFSSAPQQTLAGSATWNANPASSDWNTAANWTPATIPNGTFDIATFGPSAVTTVSINTTTVSADSLIFEADAPPYTVNVDFTGVFENLTLYGSGIVNHSGATQSINVNLYSQMNFYNSATAGEMTHFGGQGANSFLFHDSSTAASSTFDLTTSGGSSTLIFSEAATAADATVTTGGYWAYVTFLGGSTAGNAVIQAIHGGSVIFAYNSSAGHVTATCDSDGSPYAGAGIFFQNSATAAEGTFIANGGTSGTYYASSIIFADACTAGAATFLLHGGDGKIAEGAHMFFYSTSTADQATITVEGGTNGGAGATVGFLNESTAGNARLILSGNGELYINFHDTTPVSIGSLEGTGIVHLGARRLTVGSNNLSTTFTGSIKDGVAGPDGGLDKGNSLGKTGSGTLTLRGASAYSGGTVVGAGTLLVKNTIGSPTGSGPVRVDAGTLGGQGQIAGAVTIGSGNANGRRATLAPGVKGPGVLAIGQRLTIRAGGRYQWELSLPQGSGDEVIAKEVTLESGAQFELEAQGTQTLPVGRVFTVIANQTSEPINGTFANLPDGVILSVNGNNLQASYEGGDGNDLTLTVVP